jgi:hypothetical protein
MIFARFKRPCYQGIVSAFLTLAGFLAGLAATRVEAGHTPASARFAGTPEFAIWSIGVGFEVALWVNLWLRMVPLRAEVRARMGRADRWSAVAVILMIAVLLRLSLLLYPPIQSGFYAFLPRRLLLWLGMLLALTPAVVSAWQIRLRLVRLNAGPFGEPGGRPAGEVIADLLTTTGILHRLLTISSAIVVVSVLDVAAFRNAVLAHAPGYRGFPVNAVLLYGVLLTVVLAFVYIPIYSTLNDHEERLRDTLFPVPADGRPDADWDAARGRLENLLQLSRGPWERIRVGYGVLAPLLGSVLAVFLPGVRF